MRQTLDARDDPPQGSKGWIRLININISLPLLLWHLCKAERNLKRLLASRLSSRRTHMRKQIQFLYLHIVQSHHHQVPHLLILICQRNRVIGSANLSSSWKTLPFRLHICPICPFCSNGIQGQGSLWHGSGSGFGLVAWFAMLRRNRTAKSKRMITTGL